MVLRILKSSLHVAQFLNNYRAEPAFQVVPPNCESTDFDSVNILAAIVLGGVNCNESLLFSGVRTAILNRQNFQLSVFLLEALSFH